MVSSFVFFKHRNDKPDATQAPTSPNFGSTMMEEDVSAAEAVILKWAVEGSEYARTTSLFYESPDEARQFLSAVAALQRTMHFFVGSRDREDQKNIARAYRLIQTAMARLQKEFYQLLAANRHRLDSESLHRSSVSTSTSGSSFEDLCAIDDEQAADQAQQSDDLSPSTSHSPSPSLSMPAESLTPSDLQQQQVISDLRSIAESMVAAGYAKECFKAYEAVRRSNVDESLFSLGFPRVSPAQLHRLGGSTETRLKLWPQAARSAVRSLFSGERILCDGVFGFSDKFREDMFAEITSAGAIHLFAFPEMIAKAARKSPEMTFQLLDVYDALVELQPEVELIFSHKCAAAVTAQVVTSINKIGEAVHLTLAEFDLAIQKYNSKGPVPGGAIHPLSRYVMNYLAFLSDYGPELEEILVNHPLPPQKPLPDCFFFPPSSFTPPTSAPASPSRGFDHDCDDIDQKADYLDETAAAPGNVAPRVAWLLLVLLCRLDSKAGLYKNNVAQAYLFLANNVNYIVSKVRTSGLRLLLGAQWVSKHEEKARYYAHSYLKVAWAEVTEAIPADPQALLSTDHRVDGLAAAGEMMRLFNAAFERAYLRQAGWVVPDRRMRDELKKSIARKVLMPYAEFYSACRPELMRAGHSVDVRFAPEDVGNYLSDLFISDVGGSVGSTSASGSASPSDSGSSKASSWWRSQHR